MRMVSYLELGGFHGDGDADEEDAEHGDGRVAAPVHGPAVGPARHAPHLLPEVAASAGAMVAAHLRRRRCECSSGFGSVGPDRGRGCGLGLALLLPCVCVRERSGWTASFAL
jgi:hypothetical protein